MIPTQKSFVKSIIQLQQVRFLKRRLAYPQAYEAKAAPLSHPKKDHASFFHRHLKEWLGPKNIRGEYYRNKYYYPPQDHKPKYIVPDGNTIVDSSSQESSTSRRFLDRRRNPSLHPFPMNPHCKTASVISHELKNTIWSEVKENGLHSQEVAHKYGIKIARVEAIVKLQDIEQEWKNENKISPDLAKYAETMYKMFPLYEPSVHAENLTEIPAPHKTLQQRFMSIAESEPFGPIDAANVLEIEPAQTTLNKLTEFTNDEKSTTAKLNKVVLGSEKEGDKCLFKFTCSNSGDVGYRYGSSRRDRKKDRKIGFDRAGHMVNLF